MSGRLSISDHSSGRWGRIAACMFTRCTLNCRGVENCSNVEFVNENHSYRELQFFFLNKTSLSPFCLVPEFSQYTQSWIAGRRKRLLLHRALAPPDRLPRRVHSHVDLSHFGLSVPLPAPAMHIKRRCVPQRPDCFFFFFFFSVFPFPPHTPGYPRLISYSGRGNRAIAQSCSAADPRGRRIRSFRSFRSPSHERNNAPPSKALAFLFSSFSACPLCVRVPGPSRPPPFGETSPFVCPAFRVFPV